MINPNAAFEDELYFQYLKDPQSVSSQWREYFEQSQGKTFQAFDEKGRELTAKQQFRADDADSTLISGDNLMILPKIPALIADNMETSLEIPTATSSRAIPVKALDENRRVINKYLLKLKRPKVSFTHILAWAMVKSLIKYPNMNDAFFRKNGKPHRLRHNAINIGLAVDVVKKDGTRLLLVPNIKSAENMDFSTFIEEFNNLINKTRTNSLSVDDLSGTTVTLTNPGMIGTTASNPRLMKGQGLIVASGSIDYPVEFQAVRPEVLTTLAVSKTVTITSTYDHRIIQGAESAEFLAYMNKLLLGGDRFYDQIFANLKIPFEPIRWAADQTTGSKFSLFDEKEAIEKSAHIMLMINAYRVRGHLLASVNPLGFESYYYPELDPAYYGFTIWDLDRTFHADDRWNSNEMPVRSIIELLRETYCGPIGIEFMHIQHPEKKNWIKETLERTRNTRIFSREEKIDMYKKLVRAEEFENFLHTKFVGHKRFSLEGSESLIVIIDKILQKAADDNLHTAVLGMAHRGRLNVLVNNVGKDLRRIFAEFDDEIDPLMFQGSGDVKYHLGAEGRYFNQNNKSIDIILSPNPSHLELVDPVIEGMARAIENKIKDAEYTQVLPILVHGDAAFAGQGIVAETLNMSELEGYKTGGTIHIIVNNQIGFTTTTDEARSTVYATDIAKMIQVPIIHVNGFDPEAVANATEFAVEYRKKFNNDVIIDLLCYRKYGHNESDEPAYTQPLLYKKIKSLPQVGEKYKADLIKEGILTEDQATAFVREIQEDFYKIYQQRKSSESNDIPKQKTKEDDIIFKDLFTAVATEDFNTVAQAITSVPENFSIHPKLKHLFKKRIEMTESEKPAIDWAMAELLAFGTILKEGKDIRFSGQDSRRGTFSQRHAVIVDIKTEENYTPLNNISNDQGQLRLYDSPLSEMAVLGFEYGYSVIAQDSLTLWEAQFGDFANNAQTIVDQFLSCAEVKWGQTSNLVMLLPHSYDGMGPEHSNARHERYLQLCADNNMIVCNLSTPAQYFHALRRQVTAKNKKPLIIMTPKSLLRHPETVSAPKDFTEGKFMEIIDDNAELNNVRRVLLCTGKIYYDLLAEQKKNTAADIAIVRVEQQYPFNRKLLAEILKQYQETEDIVWVQEEPKNYGAWSFLAPRIVESLSQNQKLRYIGRRAAAATSTGSYKVHVYEQNKIISEAFG